MSHQDSLTQFHSVLFMVRPCNLHQHCPAVYFLTFHAVKHPIAMHKHA